MKKLIYIADIDQDIDDIIAVDFLNQQGALKGVVFDPAPKSELGKQRIEEVKKMGVKIFEDIPPCEYVFNGGAFTKLAKYLLRNKAKIIVANGGFIGDNIMENPLEKFKGKKYCRTYNFNIDVTSTVQVINSKNFTELYLIGKNVCHSEINTRLGIWKNSEFLDKYNLSKTKRLHDLLMVQEGLKIINDNINDSILEFSNVTCIYDKLNGKQTHWGSEAGGNTIAAIKFK